MKRFFLKIIKSATISASALPQRLPTVKQGLILNVFAIPPDRLFSKPKRGKRLDKKKLMERIEAFKKRDIVKSLIVEGENAKYDLINNNLLPFNLDLTYDSEKRRVNSEEFYREAINHYEKNRSVFI